MIHRFLIKGKCCNTIEIYVLKLQMKMTKNEERVSFKRYYDAFKQMPKHDPRYMSKPQARKVYREYANTCIKKLTRLKVVIPKSSIRRSLLLAIDGKIAGKSSGSSGSPGSPVSPGMYVALGHLFPEESST